MTWTITGCIYEVPDNIHYMINGVDLSKIWELLEFVENHKELGL